MSSSTISTYLRAGDIERPGLHCDGSHLNRAKALDWMVENKDYADNALKDGYWENIDVRSNRYAVVSANTRGDFAVATTRDELPDEDRWLSLQMQLELPTADYVSWAATQYPNVQRLTTLRLTSDYGATWRQISNLPVEINDLVLTDDGALFATGPEGLYQAAPNATTLAPVGFAGDTVLAIERTEAGRLFAYTSKRGLVASDDDGQSWQDLAIAYETDTTGSLPFFLSYQGGVLLVQRSGPIAHYSEDGGKSWTTTKLPGSLCKGWLHIFARRENLLRLVRGHVGHPGVTRCRGKRGLRLRALPIPCPSLARRQRVTCLPVRTNDSATAPPITRRPGKRKRATPFINTLRVFGRMNLAWGPNGKAMEADAHGIFRLHTPETIVLGSAGAAGQTGVAGAGGESFNSSAGGGAGG